MTDMPDRIARHLVALGPRIPPLSEFVDEVLADETPEWADYWPATATFDDSAWTEAEQRWAAGDR